MGCSGRESHEGKSTVTPLHTRHRWPSRWVSIYGVKLSAQALNFAPHGHDTDLSFLGMDDARNTELALSKSTRSLNAAVLSVQVNCGCLNDLFLAGGGKVRPRYIRGTLRLICSEYYLARFTLREELWLLVVFGGQNSP